MNGNVYAIAVNIEVNTYLRVPLMLRSSPDIGSGPASSSAYFRHPDRLSEHCPNFDLPCKLFIYV